MRNVACLNVFYHTKFKMRKQQHHQKQQKAYVLTQQSFMLNDLRLWSLQKTNVGIGLKITFLAKKKLE